MSSWCFPEVPRKVYAIALKRPNYLRKLLRKAFHGQPPARKVFDGYAQGARKVWHMHGLVLLLIMNLLSFQEPTAKVC